MLSYKGDQSNPLRILVVDDNIDAATLTGSLLRHLGYDVRIEYSAEAALEQAEVDIFDFCLLDIGLPGMDGYELAAKLREKPNTQTAVFAALTGYGSETYINKSEEQGFSYHFVKPVPIPKLFDACAEISKKIKNNL